MMTRTLKATPGGIRRSSATYQGQHHGREQGPIEEPTCPAPQLRVEAAGTSDRALVSAAAREHVAHWASARDAASSLDQDDEVDRALRDIGVSRQPKPDRDPRQLVPHAATMTDTELGELLILLSVEHERVSRITTKQNSRTHEVARMKLDREADVRADGEPGERLRDRVRRDPLWRALDEAHVLNSRVLNELRADLDALDRHHAAVSRLIEVRRMELQRDLIDINVANRRLPFSR